MKQVIFVMVLFLWGTPGLAQDSALQPTNAFDQQPAASTQEFETVTRVVHQDSLASYLGLTAKEAEFAPPRNFRAEHLNEVQLDGE